MIMPPTLVPTNARLIASPRRDTNQFEITREQGMIVAVINPHPMTPNAT
jgi:hypothetical protein